MPALDIYERVGDYQDQERPSRKFSVWEVGVGFVTHYIAVNHGHKTNDNISKDIKERQSLQACC